ncbi:hypothetical protein HYFRA_00004742 [Hymenoscyphus fraxineus]|uniref:Cytochrome P450 n=1 Tax=Hymenoscyphus fraxineus TaxID=746836 RepID=A0A9N9PPM7_9HELO|nr:hypothetical protein HYFRA_00004742 [Hymenoscyphus fraxineus]
MAIFTVVCTLLALPTVLFVWTAQALAHNCARAKSCGLPYVVRWISPINPFWLLYGSSFVRLCTRLGIATQNLQRFYPYGWEANERAKAHLDYGDVFMVVHPGGIQLCVSNAGIIYDILQRRTDFRRNMEEMAVLNVYGKNLSTTDDQEWQQHRKMTAVTFTEKNNEIVWEQSLKQAIGMLDYWTKRAELPIRSIDKDTKVFTLNVLAAALFNKVYDFESQTEAKTEKEVGDTSHQYRESLSTILSSIILIFIFGEEGLKKWWVPDSWKEAATAMASFRSYIHALMNEERGFLKEGKDNNKHLVARLVRACEDQPLESTVSDHLEKEKSNKRITLTEEEILSNLFVYAFAGNDTTAITLTNLLVHLSAHPETQEWISEEINHYLPGDASTSWSYETCSKLKRCGAVVLESLRICHPLSQLVKTTGSIAQPLKIDGTMYMIPAGTSVHCSLGALHTHSLYWTDPMAWNPSRFISSTKPEDIRNYEDEVLAADTSDHFMPFAWGQRVCPGKRFAQVELVAAIAMLFKDWRIKPEPEKGETEAQARDRAWKSSLIVDHEGHMLHEMVEPEKVGMSWIKNSKVDGPER